MAQAASGGRNFSTPVQQTVVINGGLRFAPSTEGRVLRPALSITLMADMGAVLHARTLLRQGRATYRCRSQKTKSL
jgi:hypothetical protein